MKPIRHICRIGPIGKRWQPLTSHFSPISALALPRPLPLFQMHIEFDLSGLQPISEGLAFLRVGASIDRLPKRINFLEKRNLRRDASCAAKE